MNKEKHKVEWDQVSETNDTNNTQDTRDTHETSLTSLFCIAILCDPSKGHFQKIGVFYG